MRLNWRGRAAKLWVFYDSGEALMLKVRNLLVAGAALKILGVPLIVLALATPVVIVAYIGIGYLWLHYGWMRQQSEVGVIEAFNPIERWRLHMEVRLYERLGLPLNDMDLSRLPDAYQHILSSARER